MSVFTIASFIISGLAIAICGWTVYYTRRLRRAREEIQRQRKRVNVIVDGDWDGYEAAMRRAAGEGDT